MVYIIKSNNVQERFYSPTRAYEAYVRAAITLPRQKVIIERREKGKTTKLKRIELEAAVIRATEPMDILEDLTDKQLRRLVGRK